MEKYGWEGRQRFPFKKGRHLRQHLGELGREEGVSHSAPTQAKPGRQTVVLRGSLTPGCVVRTGKGFEKVMCEIAPKPLQPPLAHRVGHFTTTAFPSRHLSQFGTTHSSGDVFMPIPHHERGHRMCYPAHYCITRIRHITCTQ